MTSRKSEAERHREDAHSSLRIQIEMAKDAAEQALDWALSWPNDITGLEEDLSGIVQKLSVIHTKVAPPDFIGDTKPEFIFDDLDLIPDIVIRPDATS